MGHEDGREVEVTERQFLRKCEMIQQHLHRNQRHHLYATSSGITKVRFKRCANATAPNDQRMGGDGVLLQLLSHVLAFIKLTLLLLNCPNVA